MDFEDATLKETYTDYTPNGIAGRQWVLTNAHCGGANDGRPARRHPRRPVARPFGRHLPVGALTNGIGDFRFAYAPGSKTVRGSTSRRNTMPAMDG
jgi:hypothetical protein